MAVIFKEKDINELEIISRDIYIFEEKLEYLVELMK